MKIAEVVGNVVATIKDEAHQNQKLLIVQVCDEKGNYVEEEKIAIDKADAGIGDLVLMFDDGGASRMIMGGEEIPVDCVIAGVIDKPYQGVV